MSDQYSNFYYSPSAQGYDSDTWRTLFGTPGVSNNRLILSDAGILHYGQMLRGDAYFGINSPAPSSGLSKKFGFYQPGRNAYAYFSISGANLTAETSNGTTTNTSAITWQSAWTNTNTEFRVKWEAGTVIFYINGNQQASIQDASVASDPMSLYMTNNSNDQLFLNYIQAKAMQSYIISEVNAGAAFESLISESDLLTITDVPTVLIPTLFAPANGGITFDGITLTDVPTVETPRFNITVSESLTVTDVRTVGTPA